MRTGVGMVFHLIYNRAARFRNTYQSASHGGKPHGALLVAFDVEHALVAQFLDVDAMVITTCVQDTYAVGIGAHPDAAFLVLADGKHRTVVHVVGSQLASVLVELVESVLVGSHP